MIIGQLPFYQIWKTHGATFWKRRRFKKMLALFDFPADHPLKILEVGCANGKDFIQFLPPEGCEIWGADICPCTVERADFHFVRADAAALPFEDKSFDLVVSVGLLEHIEPMEKLCKVIQEFDRVGRHQISVVPSISSILEPHCGKFFFPFRLRRDFCGAQLGQKLHLNFFTEHTWTKFCGFADCTVKRFFYIIPWIKNTMIYK